MSGLKNILIAYYASAGERFLLFSISLFSLCLFLIMFDFLHSILKCQFLNRIQIYRIFYHQLRDRNGSRKSSHTSRARTEYRVIRALLVHN